MPNDVLNDALDRFMAISFSETFAYGSFDGKH